MSRSFVSLTPGVQGGSPCLNNTRMTVEAAVGAWWQFGHMDLVRMCYPDLTIDDVQVACWYVGRYGRKKWRRRFGEWLHGSVLRSMPPWSGAP